MEIHWKPPSAPHRRICEHCEDVSARISCAALARQIEVISTNQPHFVLHNQHALLKRGVNNVSYHLLSADVYDTSTALQL